MKTSILGKYSSVHLILPVFLFWVIYSSLYLSLVKMELGIVAGFFALVGQVGLDLVASFLTFNLYLTASEARLKIIYGMFFISFIFATIADAIYHCAMNILNNQYFYNINSFFEIPFFLFLLFQVTAWGVIFFSKQCDLGNTQKHTYIPYLMVSILVFLMFMFGIPWQIDLSSSLGIYQIIDTILEVIGFTLVAACLARAKEKEILLVSVGYLVIISSDLLIRYNVISGMIPFLNPFETTWILGLLMMTSSFFFQKKNNLPY